MGFGTMTNKQRDMLLKQARELAKQGNKDGLQKMINKEADRQSTVLNSDPKTRGEISRRQLRREQTTERRNPERSKTLPNGQESWLGDDGEWYVD